MYTRGAESFKGNAGEGVNVNGLISYDMVNLRFVYYVVHVHLRAKGGCSRDTPLHYPRARAPHTTHTHTFAFSKLKRFCNTLSPFIWNMPGTRGAPTWTSRGVHSRASGRGLPTRRGMGLPVHHVRLEITPRSSSSAAIAAAACEESSIASATPQYARHRIARSPSLSLLGSNTGVPLIGHCRMPES
jgi:hypothetical protein